MDKVKIGVLGLRRGITHLSNLLRLEQAQVIGAADRLAVRRKRGEEILAGTGAKVVAEFDELLAMQPDAVVIASNGKLQVEHSCQAMEAGCHVLSEVPGAYTLEECIRLRDTVERTGRTYMFGENCCFLGFLPYWRKWVMEGRLGPVAIAEGEYLHYLPHTLQTPDGTVLSPSQAQREGRTDCQPVWRADQPPIQYLTHDLGPLLEVLDDRVVSVSCRSASWRCKEAPLRSDGQIALFETQKGTLVKILVTLNTVQPCEHRYRIMGTAGTVEYFHYEPDYCRLATLRHNGGHQWQYIPVGWTPLGVDASAGHGGIDLALLRTFLDILLRGRPSPIDVYRCIDYTLPGIMAAKSADLGGIPLPVPDLRPEPFAGSRLWEVIELPTADPEPNS
ncbi:MAG: Gfo/Idh/MocA family protein [Candidatus Zipacnadales bacterium]